MTNFTLYIVKIQHSLLESFLSFYSIFLYTSPHLSQEAILHIRTYFELYLSGHNLLTNENQSWYNKHIKKVIRWVVSDETGVKRKH